VLDEDCGVRGLRQADGRLQRSDRRQDVLPVLLDAQGVSPAVREALHAAKAALAGQKMRERGLDLVGRWRLVDTGHVFRIKSVTPDGLALVTSDARCWHVAMSDLRALRDRGALQYLGR
jgi:hypothetical protein